MGNLPKLFLTDIDGVWTDGGMYYDEISGNELKKFNTSDSAGVIFMRTLGIETVIITGEDTQIVKRRADKLGIKHVFLGVSDKVECARLLLDTLGLDFSEVAYIGDDINDIKLLKKVGVSGCPYNAPNYIKEIVQIVTRKRGGEGAYREFVEIILEKEGILRDVINML